MLSLLTTPRRYAKHPVGSLSPTPEELAALHVDWRPLLRCKLNVSGPRAVRCWDASGAPVALPEDLRGLPMSVKIRLDRLWIMSKEFGLVAEITDIQLHESDAATCPF